MRKFVVNTIICLLIFSLSGTALAHSTQGRIKIPLSKKTLKIEDIAFFVDSYVHRELYKGKFEKAEKRFYVNKYLKIDQDQDTAVIYFKTLDNKTKTYFDDKMLIHRQPEGVWAFKGPDEVRPMYTYVNKTGYYYKKYILPVSLVGIFLGLISLVIPKFRRRTKSVKKVVQKDGATDQAGS